ncbi:MAG: hypothetical protein HS108_02455 [Planctomycetes bacterium]|nr:hypothetical protein [Planctomycetota bacterium]
MALFRLPAQLPPPLVLKVKPEITKVGVAGGHAELAHQHREVRPVCSRVTVDGFCGPAFTVRIGTSICGALLPPPGVPATEPPLGAPAVTPVSATRNSWPGLAVPANQPPGSNAGLVHRKRALRRRSGWPCEMAVGPR